MKKIFLFILVFLFLITSVSAIECGDTIEEDTILEEDLLNCGGHGLIIDANDITLDCQGHIIDGNDGNNNRNSNGVYLNNKERVTIINCNIREFGEGIFLRESNSNNIIDNNLHNNFIRGIFLHRSNNNNIYINNANDNRFAGIFIDLSQNNRIYYNNIEGNSGYNDAGFGILLEWSGNNYLWNNYIINNGRDNAMERSESNNNNWDLNQIGNYWSDFEDNEGYPDNYIIHGNGEGVDRYPRGPGDPEFIEPTTINLNEGWNLISYPLIPLNPNIEFIFSDLVENGKLVMVKDEDGRFYSPENNFSNIPEWNPQEAYFVKVTEDAELRIWGIEPINPRIELEQGWNFMVYPLSEIRNMDFIIENILFHLIEENILEIIKNDDGEFYNPQYNYNGIEQMIPGEGYQIKVRNNVVIDFGEGLVNHAPVCEIPEDIEIPIEVEMNDVLTLYLNDICYDIDELEYTIEATPENLIDFYFPRFGEGNRIHIYFEENYHGDDTSVTITASDGELQSEPLEIPILVLED